MVHTLDGLAEPQGFRIARDTPLHRAQSPWPHPAMAKSRSWYARQQRKGEEAHKVMYTLALTYQNQAPWY
jgi:hypothetical protein